MSTSNKSTFPNSNESTHSIGALLLLIVAAIAIVLSLVMSGARLFGGSSGEEESGPDTPPENMIFNVVKWPTDMPLADYALDEGFLIIADSQHTPNMSQMQVLSFQADRYTLSGLGANLEQGEMRLNKTALDALNAMTYALNQDCSFDGALLIQYAYSVAAPNGNDDYRTGLTVSLKIRHEGTTIPLSEATGDSPADWLNENAWKYGFILRYPEGAESTGKENGVADVYRYVGIPHAYYINYRLELPDSVKDEADTAADTDTVELGGDDAKTAVPALEDYIALIKTKTAKKPLAITVKDAANDEDNGGYLVYYIAASDTDKAMVPENYTVTNVSGIRDGYIVTVRPSSAVDQPSDSSSESQS